jgi:hypothetical protein
VVLYNFYIHFSVFRIEKKPQIWITWLQGDGEHDDKRVTAATIREIKAPNFSSMKNSLRYCRFFTIQFIPNYIPFLFLCLSPASAFFKVPCSTSLVIERADPLISTGVAFNHVHTIMGGSGFGFTMNYDMAQLQNATPALRLKINPTTGLRHFTSMPRMVVPSKSHRTADL